MEKQVENIDILLSDWYYNDVLENQRQYLVGLCISKRRKNMKKFLNVILCTCMLLTCVPIQAMAMTTDITDENGLVQVATTRNINKDEAMSVEPRNQDYIQLNGANNYQGTFYVRRGENVKIHMYIDYYSGLLIPIRVHFNKGSNPSTIVTTWTGTGHKYADLCINCQSPGEYSVWLEGNFRGSGAVYREP